MALKSLVSLMHCFYHYTARFGTNGWLYQLIEEHNYLVQYLLTNNLFNEQVRIFEGVYAVVPLYDC